MRIPVRRAWLGFFKPPEPDEGESLAFIILSETTDISYCDRTLSSSSISMSIELHRKCERRSLLAPRCDRKYLAAHDRLIDHFRFDARGYVTRYRAPIASIDRWEIAPRDVDRVDAQFAHYRESEDKQAPFLVSSR